jgi:hypothetical protein
MPRLWQGDGVSEVGLRTIEADAEMGERKHRQVLVQQQQDTRYEHAVRPSLGLRDPRQSPHAARLGGLGPLTSRSNCSVEALEVPQPWHGCR